MMVLLTWHFLYTQGLPVINSHLFYEVLNQERSSVGNRIMLALFQYDTFLCWYLWFFFYLACCTLGHYWILELVWTHPKSDSAQDNFSSWLTLGYLDSSLPLYFLIFKKKWFLPDLIDVVYFKIDAHTTFWISEFIFYVCFFNCIFWCLKS